MDLLTELSEGEIREWFPNFDRDTFLKNKTSPPSEAYNCFAWAAGDSMRKWDWSGCSGRHWPDNVRPSGDARSLQELYQKTGGYSACENSSFETGFEKIALYVGDDGEVKHAARQLPSGLWTSKLGDYEDIQHELAFLEGGGYGWPKVFLKRAIR